MAEKHIVLDAKDAIVGRLASFAAKEARRGARVDIINAEKAIMSGNRTEILARYAYRSTYIGNIRRGPYTKRRPDMFVRRIVRGMLPFDKSDGRDAFRRVMCYMGVPKNFESAKIVTLKGINVDKLPTLKYITILDICKHLGGA